MTHRHTANETTYSGKRHVKTSTTEQNFTENGWESVGENSPNWVGYTTVADDGTPIVYKSNDHRLTPAKQYNENATP